MKTTIIFDMDGVIFDSEKMYMDELIRFHKQHNIILTYEECRKVIGVDRKVFDHIVYSWWNHRIPLYEVKALLNEFYQTVDRDYTSIINPHVELLLKYLHSHRYKIALASSSNEKTIDKALTTSHLKQYFQIITSGNSFKESKPNPEIYLYSLKQLNSTKEETIIIEDSPSGIQAAVNAGIDVIALRDTKFQLDQSQANIIIDDIEQVIDYL